MYDSIMECVGGTCLTCGDIPTKMISYDVGEPKLIEKYCDRCFNK